MRVQIVALILAASILFSPLAAAGRAAPAAQDCVPGVPPGEWLGTFSQTYTASQSNIGGLNTNMTATSEAAGTLALQVTCEGLVSGTIDIPYTANWTITGLVNVSDGCSGHTVFSITEGSVILEGGLPLFVLTGTAQHTTNCSDEAPASETLTARMQATTAEGGLISSDLPFLGDVLKQQQMAELEAGGAAETSVTSYWELTHTDTHTVLGVTGRYEQYFLQGIPVTNTYTATVDWQDAAPGGVNFVLNGQEVAGAQSGGPDTWTASLPLEGLPAGVYPLQVTALNASGQASPVYTKVVAIVPMPAWGPGLGFVTLENDPTILYRGKALLPAAPLEYLVSLPAFLPLVGGDWGLKATQIQASIEATSAGGPESDFITGTGGLALGGNSFDLTISGNTQTTLAADALTFDSGQADLSLPPLAYTKQVGLLDLVPGVSAVYGQPVIGDLLQALNAILNVTGTIETQVTGKTDLGVENDAITVVAGEVRDDLKVELVANIGIDGVALAYVGGGGQGHLVLALHPETAVKECQVNLFFLAGYAVFNFFTGGTIAADEYNHAWQVAQCEPAALVYRPDKLAAPTGAASSLTLPARPASWQPEQAVVNPAVAGKAELTTLVQGAHPGAAPALAAGPQNRLAFAWVGEDAAQPRGAGFEVYLRLSDGGTWGETIRLTEDAAFDTAPAVAFDGQGRTLVAWVANPAGGLAEGAALDEAFVSGLEIAYAVVDPASGAVTSHGQLTSDTRLDYGVQLATDSEGGVWAAWQHSPANALVGTAAAPNALQAARWDGAAWGAAQTVDENLTGTLWWQLAAHDAATAMILADLDTDGDLATGNDREILALTWDGAAWASHQLTNNNQPDLAPRAAYTPEGAPLAAWLAGGQVVGVQGDLTAAPSVWLAEGGSTALGQGRLLAGPAGQLALLWPEMTPAGADVWLSVYSAESGTWRAPEVVFGSADWQETSLTAAAGPGGDVWLGLVRLPVETRAVTLPDGQTLDIPAAGDTAELAVAQVASVFSLPESPAEAPSRLGLWLGLGALALAGLGVGVWLMRRKR